MKSMRFSDAEWRVMQVLWQHAPVTARDILEHLGPKAEWAYTTVKTMLTRLVAKGAVGEELRANVAIYQPKVTRLSARRSAVRSLVERHREYTGSTVAARLLADWTAAVKRFVKVLPEEYGKVLARAHLDTDEARVAAV